MLSLHRIKSQIEDISLSIEELIFNYFNHDQKFQANILRTIQRLDQDIDDLDEMLSQFGDTSQCPLDFLTSYDLNNCQTALSDFASLLVENPTDTKQIKTVLDNLQHNWNKLNQFADWFEKLRNTNLVIIKDGLTFDDVESASAFLEMIKHTLQAEALLLNKNANDNRATRALSQATMQYGSPTFLTKTSTPMLSRTLDMQLATESGKIINLTSESNSHIESIMQTLRWKIVNPRQWQQSSITQDYLNYTSRKKSDSIVYAPQNPLQFSNIYNPKATPTLEVPELPLGVALACAQRLIDDGQITEQDVFTEHGQYGVLTESNLNKNNLSLTVSKLDGLFSCFVDTYQGNCPRPSTIEFSSYQTPRYVC